jgi:hypothetical protein
MRSFFSFSINPNIHIELCNIRFMLTLSITLKKIIYSISVLVINMQKFIVTNMCYVEELNASAALEQACKGVLHRSQTCKMHFGFLNLSIGIPQTHIIHVGIFS